MGQKGNGFEVFADGVQIDVSKNTDIYAVGRGDATSESGYDEFALMTAGTYYIYSDNENVTLFVVAWREGTNVTLGASVGGVAKEIGVMDGDKLQILLRTGAAFNGKVKAMISKLQPTTANYEPYTGGKPSPSPEYPQPIVSSGDDGSIGLDITGANLINASSIKSEERNGVKLTNNGDGSFTFKGTTTENYFVTTRDYLTNLVPGEYAFALDGAKNVQAVIRYTKDGVNRSWLADSKQSFDGSETNIFFYMQVRPNFTVNETVFPMLNVGSVFLDFEEHKEQFVSIPTPNGLPGIPVSSGGNYTDEKGQQWVADEIDLARGERVQETIKVVLDGSQKITLQKHLDFNRFAIGENDFPIPSGYAGFCSHFIVNPSPVTMNTIDGAICVYSNGNIYLRSDRFKSADELKSFLKENPVTLEYCLAEPIRTPLPPETIAAYKALHTYSPTTTVINDAGAGMIVGYKRRK